jgi:predicted metal-binding protein
MARIGIITCSNCTGELDCSSVVCLADMRKRKGFFAQYPAEERLDLVGIISCAGCPTVAAPRKILRRVRSLAEFRVEVIHFSYCMTALCPFKEKYARVIQEIYPDIKLVMGTHTPIDQAQFQGDVRDMLCAGRKNMTDHIKDTSVPK